MVNGKIYGMVVKIDKAGPALVREGHLLVHTGKLPEGYDLVKALEEDREARIQEIWSR